MRRTASEIIRNLEARVARLERRANPTWTWKETRIAIRDHARTTHFPKMQTKGYEFQIRGGERDQQIGVWWRKQSMYGLSLHILVKVEELSNGMTRFNFIEEGNSLSWSPSYFHSSDWQITDAESAVEAFHKASMRMSNIAEKKLEDGTFKFK